MPDSSDDAAIAIADVLLEFINALAQHAVRHCGRAWQHAQDDIALAHGNP